MSQCQFCRKLFKPQGIKSHEVHSTKQYEKDVEQVEESKVALFTAAHATVHTSTSLEVGPSQPVYMHDNGDHDLPSTSWFQSMLPTFAALPLTDRMILLTRTCGSLMEILPHEVINQVSPWKVMVMTKCQPLNNNLLTSRLSFIPAAPTLYGMWAMTASTTIPPMMGMSYMEQTTGLVPLVPALVMANPSPDASAIKLHQALGHMQVSYNHLREELIKMRNELSGFKAKTLESRATVNSTELYFMLPSELRAQAMKYEHFKQLMSGEHQIQPTIANYSFLQFMSMVNSEHGNILKSVKDSSAQLFTHLSPGICCNFTGKKNLSMSCPDETFTISTKTKPNNLIRVPF
ncbi:hypothetical protein F5141DRAFT_1062233 [Pisolithus sp. B1]|nr:hypothetical protein F5141DRAFT_1062233 [Pisolithus sp. B1]